MFDDTSLRSLDPNIQIPDTAFERLFDLFDSYRWHLDDRPLRADNEINPDVLGYIFEKYINQKQMGAYYTKEDITEYITANTLIPRFLERLTEESPFDFGDAVRVLSASPDRYIFEPARYGTDRDLPPQIAAGVDDVHARTQWNSPAPEEYALPTETWRDVVVRRYRHSELRRALMAGEATRPADLIAFNIDLRQLSQDLIENCESPALLRKVYQVLASLSVLDPTCGSGAFLFAALNVLQPLYDAALERMEAFIRDGIGDLGDLGAFTAVIGRMNAHPSRDFFVLKTIVVNNLYGVDIMEEAVEICKLRLFLRLVSQINDIAHLEPLPDIDFNIRAGNTLVGFATLEELSRQLGSRLDLDSRAGQIIKRSAAVDRSFERFRELQLTDTIDEDHSGKVKQTLRDELEVLRNELDAYLASQYGVKPEQNAPFEQWRTTHLPFHWFIEFHQIMAGRGFDVTIGNPPFVEYAKVRSQYTVEGFETLDCGNLYAFVLERSFALAGHRGRTGMISPLSLACTTRMASLRKVLSRHEVHLPCFDIRPNGLFDGVTQRLCFVFTSSNDGQGQTWTAGYRRWFTQERPTLLSAVDYTAIDRPDKGASLPKFALDIEKSIYAKLGKGSLELLAVRSGEPIYIHRIVRYFIKALDFVPLFIDADGQRGRSDDYKPFRFRREVTPFVVALTNSSLFYWYWRCYSDGFHCGYGDVYRFPHQHVERADPDRFRTLTGRLMDAMRQNSAEKTISTRRGPIRYQEFYAKPIKPLLDEIDTAMADLFGFSDDELDFIINYDVKYRIGSTEE